MSDKFLYTVKAWNGKEWCYFSSVYLNPYDTLEQKKKVITELKTKYGKEYQFNISNFNNVYW